MTQEMKINVVRDGDQLMVTRTDFVDLQQSPAIFIPVDEAIGRNLNNMWIVQEMRGRAMAELESYLSVILHQFPNMFIGPCDLRDEQEGLMKQGWTAFPEGTYFQYADMNTSTYLMEAALLGAIAQDEVSRR